MYNTVAKCYYSLEGYRLSLITSNSNDGVSGYTFAHYDSGFPTRPW